MTNSSQQQNGKENLGYESDEVINLPGAVSANDESGSKYEEVSSKCYQQMKNIAQKLNISIKKGIDFTIQQ